MRTIGLLLVLVPLAWGAAYTDPSGRYSVEMPAGWKAAQLNSDAVQLASGAAYVTVMVLPGADTAVFIESIARQTGGQWRGFAEAQRGETKLAGRAGRYVTYAGTNPAGADAYLEMIAIADRGATYLLMISAPKQQFGAMQGAFDQIEKSFTLTSRAMTSAPQYFRMKKATVIDEHGFERPLPAVSLLIPSDWKFQSNVQYSRAPGCPGNLVKIAFRATSPDGKMALEFLPGNVWQWSDDPNSVRLMQQSNQQMAQFGGKGCDVQPPMTAGDYLRRAVLPGARADARVAAIEPMPDLAQQVQQRVQEAQQTMARQGIQARLRGDIGRARITYSVAGQPVEEWMTAVTFASAMPGPTMNMMTGGMGQTYFYTCASEGVFGFRAPLGQLDGREKLFLAMLSTVRVEPEWNARVQQVLANINAANVKGAADRSRIIAQSGQDISRIIHDTYENKKRSDDRVFEGISQYIRGVETFRNPGTGETVELSNQYGHAWAGANGEYILSDSASFNPNVTLGGNYTRLEQVKR